MSYIQYMYVYIYMYARMFVFTCLLKRYLVEQIALVLHCFRLEQEN